MELEHFDTFNEVMDLSFGQQWLLAYKVYSQHHYNLMNIVNEHSIANILPKGNESEFIKPLDPAVHLYKIQRTEEHVELYLVCNQKNSVFGELQVKWPEFFNRYSIGKRKAKKKKKAIDIYKTNKILKDGQKCHSWYGSVD